MNRRGFLKTVAVAVAGAAVASHIPAAWMPTAALRRETALEHLRRAFNEWAQRHKRLPVDIVVGQELFDAAEGEMVATFRFIEFELDGRCRSLKFKSASLRSDGPGWEIKSIA